MMRPLRSGAKANAAGSALRLPLPFLNSAHAPVTSAYLAHRLHPAVPAHQGPTTARRVVWLHEIKHDGFRVIARKDGARVRLYSRPGNDLTRQFPLVVEALARLRSRSCIIDGEAVACDEKTGIAWFDRLRHHRVDETVFLYAFDLIELGGDDLSPRAARGAEGDARIPAGKGRSRYPVQ